MAGGISEIAGSRKVGRPKGLPRTGGRKAGTPNKITADVRALAQQYGERAVAALGKIMADDKQPAAARVSAAKELLDRAYGKSPQPLTDSGGGSLADAVARLIEGLPS